jgi:hypothetical protein
MMVEAKDDDYKTRLSEASSSTASKISSFLNSNILKISKTPVRFSGWLYVYQGDEEPEMLASTSSNESGRVSIGSERINSSFTASGRNEDFFRSSTSSSSPSGLLDRFKTRISEVSPKNSKRAKDQQKPAFSSLKAPWRRLYAKLHDDLIAFYQTDSSDSSVKNSSATEKVPVLIYYLSDHTIYIEDFVADNRDKFKGASSGQSIKVSKSDKCSNCKRKFNGKGLKRKNCRNCGQAFCLECIPSKGKLPEKGFYEEVRICEPCIDIVQMQRSVSKPLAEKISFEGYVKPVLDPKKSRFNLFRILGLGSRTLWFCTEFTENKNDWIFYVSHIMNDQNEIEFQNITKTVLYRRETMLKSPNHKPKTSVLDVFPNADDLKKKIEKLEGKPPVFVDESLILSALDEQKIVQRLGEENSSILKVHQEIDNLKDTINLRNRSNGMSIRLPRNSVFAESSNFSIKMTAASKTIRFSPLNATTKKMREQQPPRPTIPDFKPSEEISTSEKRKKSDPAKGDQSASKNSKALGKTETEEEEEYEEVYIPPLKASSSSKATVHQNLTLIDTPVVQTPYDISEDINLDAYQPQRRINIKESVFNLNETQEGAEEEFEHLNEEEWQDANLDVKEELRETRKALKLQAYIDWVVEKTAFISDKNLDEMTRDISNIKELASKLPKITEDELEERLFLRRFEFLVEISGRSLRSMIMNCPRVLTKMIKEKISRTQLGEFSTPTPYERVIQIREEQERQAKIQALKKETLQTNSSSSPSLQAKVIRKPKKKNLEFDAVLGKSRQELEEEAYCKLLIRKGYQQNRVIEEVEKFSDGTYEELLVSYDDIDNEVERLYLEKVRGFRRMHDDSDEDENWS